MMNPEANDVLLILDEAIGPQLARYATDMEVWAIDSELNRVGADTYGHDSNARSGAGGLTVFTFDKGDYYASLVNVLEMIEEHHGLYATGTPVGKVLVCHLLRDPNIEQRLHADGFLVAHVDPEWTELRRKAPW